MAIGRKTGGRTPGVPNKVTAATRDRIESEADPIGFLIAIQNGEAIEGIETLPTLEQRMSAAVNLARKVAPDARDAPIRLDLPTIQEPGDASKAMARIVQAVAGGTITPTEGSAIAGIVDSYRRAVELEDLEQRLSDLEKRNGVR
jgi:hypothetical protein